MKIGCDSGKVEDSKVKNSAYEIEIFDEIVIEDGITEIGWEAFKGQSRVEKVTCHPH